MKLGTVIQQLCKKRGWTLARLARESKIAPQTLHNWTTGRRYINPDQLKDVADVLEVSVHYLLFGEPDPYEQKGDDVLTELFSGDVRVTIHRINKKKRS